MELGSMYFIAIRYYANLALIVVAIVCGMFQYGIRHDTSKAISGVLACWMLGCLVSPNNEDKGRYIEWLKARLKERPTNK